MEDKWPGVPTVMNGHELAVRKHFICVLLSSHGPFGANTEVDVGENGVLRGYDAESPDLWGCEIEEQDGNITFVWVPAGSLIFSGSGSTEALFTSELPGWWT